MSDVFVEKLSKRFGDVTALHDVNLHVAQGEFLTLLGPSGCGKSTTLFAIAGLDTPSGGVIRVGGQTFFDGAGKVDVPPERRNLGLVFQSYALWPHMTVAQNLAFPLKLRGVSKAEQAPRIAEALSLVDMGEYGGRFPHELSGGQQQRVALARTLVFRPTLLLLDEPLSNLDAKLRIKARGWLKSLQRQLGLTTIYVTHDQEEALALSDRIAVMNKGRIVQLDSPETIYRRPTNTFVADFIGASNFLPVRRTGATVDEITPVMTEAGVALRAVAAASAGADDGIVTVRPQHIRLSRQRPSDRGLNVLAGAITDRTYLGARHAYGLEISGHTLVAEVEEVLEPGPVFAAFEPRDTLLIAR
ncbi:ABC transporter ATP-binding protein [Caulobacter sp. 602-1]|uniref:ABC transporter ATP-binding protein n=1 Tax=Caulobacter sp. 602-1 TaxID=2492472 RepID=UPI000F62FB62|nr:ABC transporter ATP-binding protein [Caulobacter sp. 602-1]RRN63541.1 ABC transporter ATP-binding protein [Caulobacter sp. 602-1]